jgi:hypothetical protein
MKYFIENIYFATQFAVSLTLLPGVAASLTSPSPVLLLLRTEAANGED